jgi:ABC-type sulfate transport system substrate-binding protein
MMTPARRNDSRDGDDHIVEEGDIVEDHGVHVVDGLEVDVIPATMATQFQRIAQAATMDLVVDADWDRHVGDRREEHPVVAHIRVVRAAAVRDLRRLSSDMIHAMPDSG